MKNLWAKISGKASGGESSPADVLDIHKLRGKGAFPQVRHTFPGRPENEFIAMIRDNELKRPAPFSSKPLLVESDPRSFEICPELMHVPVKAEVVVSDVCISDIIGIGNANNLDNFEFGMTFRDVLFCCLHGESLVAESLEYFLDDRLKANHLSHWRSAFCEFPQREGVTGKAKGYRGIDLVQRGSKYYVENGKQRTLIAMFWIFQNYGEHGKLRSVSVTRSVPVR